MALLLKFSFEDCGICHRINRCGANVAEELVLEFVSVMLLTQAPSKEGMGRPTYLVVSEQEPEFRILGAVKGGMPKGEFRERLRAVIAEL